MQGSSRVNRKIRPVGTQNIRTQWKEHLQLCTPWGWDVCTAGRLPGAARQQAAALFGCWWRLTSAEGGVEMGRNGSKWVEMGRNGSKWTWNQCVGFPISKVPLGWLVSLAHIWMTAMTTCGKGGTKTPSETVEIPNWDGFGYKSPAKSVLTCIYYTMILAFLLYV